MSSEVRHLVDSARPYPLVRLSGMLDATTTGAVRDVLLDVLAAQPAVLLVDVAELEVGEPAAVGVLGDVRRETQWWPAAQLTLCDSREIWQESGWDVRKDCEPEVEPVADDRFSLDLEPHVGAARQSREAIAEACERWGRAELSEAACIVATEMINNVVAHARTPMIVLVATKGDGLSVAVRDRSATVPAYDGAPVSPTAYGGRGMLLIDSVASRWGSLTLANGKVVWALLSGSRG